jgi:hypothetical protein
MSLEQKYQPGTRVRVTQQVPRPVTGQTLSTIVEGTVQRYEQSKTGSWYAHAKDDRLWLDRLILKKDDGEIVYLNLDQYSAVEPIANT